MTTRIKVTINGKEVEVVRMQTSFSYRTNQVLPEGTTEPAYFAFGRDIVEPIGIVVATFEEMLEQLEKKLEA